MDEFRTRFPLTMRHLGASIPQAGSVEAFVRAVCDAHPRGDIPHRAVRDLVRFEAMVAETPPARGAIPSAPKPGASCRLAPHARLFTYGADLRGMLADLRGDRAAKPRATHGWVLVLRLADGRVEERWLAAEEGWFLERFRDAANIDASIEDDEERALFLELWREGAFVEA